MLVHGLRGYQIIYAKTTLRPRFGTGHIVQITALKELGRNPSHTKAELEYTGRDILSGDTSLG